MFKYKYPVLLLSLLLSACTGLESDSANKQQASSRLAEIVAARSDEVRARDSSRHPQQTLAFFGLRPGMKMVEVLPGGGWYTQILAPLAGSEGAIYGVNYADDMWLRFGIFSDEVIAERIASSAGFEDMVHAIAGAEQVTAKGYAFNRIDPALNGTIDAVLLIRALHNLNRFEQSAGTLSSALDQLHGMLKPGGIVGVVQHRAPEDADDDWASGKNGYLKQSYVVDMFSRHGFKLQASSEINANPKDVPGPADYVWRLPPSLKAAPDNKAAMLAIGESDRMTLSFIKV
jgi:predicted methyltransferase